MPRIGRWAIFVSIIVWLFAVFYLEISDAKKIEDIGKIIQDAFTDNNKLLVSKEEFSQATYELNSTIHDINETMSGINSTMHNINTTIHDHFTQQINSLNLTINIMNKTIQDLKTTVATKEDLKGIKLLIQELIDKNWYTIVIYWSVNVHKLLLFST